jgi:hypothetical protein
MLHQLMTGWLLLVVVAAGCGGSGDGGGSEDEDDCQTAEEIWGTKTKHLGEDCAAGSYGACKATYDDCLEGSCRYSESANDNICTLTCASDAECGGDYCRDGICQPAAVCTTYCDEVCCCEYHNDPNDPTQCVQGSCSCG